MEKYEILTKFSQDQKILITKGFYKGQVGIIKDFKIIKEETIYIIETEDKQTGKTNKLEVKENFIKKYSFFPF